MKKFLSTNYSTGSFNLATLLLRLCFGGLICLNHGMQKLKGFGKMEAGFFDPFHIGHRLSLGLDVFAEVFCGILLVLGLFTRVAAAFLVIAMAVAVFLFHKGQSLEAHELALVYLTAFFAILLVGPGRFSVDSMIGK